MKNRLLDEVDRIDTERALQIFNKVYKKTIDYDALYWKHMRNPNRIERPIVFYQDEQGNIAGMNAFMGIYLRNNKTAERLFITQSCDTAVLSDFRGKGVFTKIISKFVEENMESRFIVGFPNENSIHGFKKMGWSTKAYCTSMVGIRCNVMAGVFRHSLGFTIAKKDKSEFTCSEFREINASRQMMFERNNDIINYKLKACHGCLLVSRKNEKLCGYIIYHIRMKKGIKIWTIDDWYYDDCNSLAFMLKSICAAGVIHIPIINIDSEEYRDFQKMGLKDMRAKTKKYQEFLVSPKGIDVDFTGISLRYLDGDTILN